MADGRYRAYECLAGLGNSQKWANDDCIVDNVTNQVDSLSWRTLQPLIWTCNWFYRKRATKSKVICMIIAIVSWRVVHLNEKAWNVVLLIRHIFCVLRWEWGADNHFGEAIIGHAKSHRTTHSREWDLMCFYLLFGDKLNEKRCWNWTKIKCENWCGGLSGTDVFARPATEAATAAAAAKQVNIMSLFNILIKMEFRLIYSRFLIRIFHATDSNGSRNR